MNHFRQDFTIATFDRVVLACPNCGTTSEQRVDHEQFHATLLVSRVWRLLDEIDTLNRAVSLATRRVTDALVASSILMSPVTPADHVRAGDLEALPPGQAMESSRMLDSRFIYRHRVKGLLDALGECETDLNNKSDHLITCPACLTGKLRFETEFMRFLWEGTGPEAGAIPAQQ